MLIQPGSHCTIFVVYDLSAALNVVHFLHDFPRDDFVRLLEQLLHFLRVGRQGRLGHENHEAALELPGADQLFVESLLLLKDLILHVCIGDVTLFISDLQLQVCVLFRLAFEPSHRPRDVLADGLV